MRGHRWNARMGPAVWSVTVTTPVTAMELVLKDHFAPEVKKKVMDIGRGSNG